MSPVSPVADGVVADGEGVGSAAIPVPEARATNSRAAQAAVVPRRSGAEWIGLLTARSVRRDCLLPRPDKQRGTAAPRGRAGRVHSSVGSQQPCRPSGTRTGIRTRATGPEAGSSAGMTRNQLDPSVRSVAKVSQ